MTPVLAVVLYENHRDQAKSFGLHELVVSCVHDRCGVAVGLSRFALRRAIVGIPRSGNAKLRRSCQAPEFSNIARGGIPVIAVFDDDRVRRLLGLPADATETMVREQLRAGCPQPELLSVVLLQENTETVLLAVGRCMHLSEEALAPALGKSLEARDVLLNSAAWSTMPELRASVLRQVPALEEIVAILAARLLARMAR